MKKWSLPIGRVSGISIFIHWTFLLLIGWVIFSNLRQGQEVNEVVWSVLFVLSVFVCVTLHELGHALTAQRFNIQTKDIILLPIGGVARLESIPEDPRQELLVTLAGPAVNLVIAGLLYVMLLLSGHFPDLREFTAIDAGNFLYMLLVVNLVLAIFNMIPAFPMDGGRVLRALLTFKFPRPVATRMAANVGQVLAVVFIVTGFFYNPFLILIGIFVYLGAQAEAQFVQSRSFLAGFRVGDVLMREYHQLETSQTVADAVRMLLNTQAKDFLVMSNSQVVGTLSRNEIIRSLSEKGADVPVDEVMNREVKVLHPSMPLEQLFQGVTNKKGDTLMPVMYKDQLLGVLDVENVLEFIMVKEAVGKNQNN